jgi:hypothetical protein
VKLHGIVCCAICFALPAFAGNASSSSKSQNQDQKPAVQSASAQRSRWAVETLNQTQHAREALVNHHNATAKQDVNRALDLIGKIENTKVNNSNMSSQQMDRLVPIYSEFEQTSFLQPVLMAQHKSSADNSQKDSSQMAKNSSSSMPQSDRSEAVTTVDQGYTTIALDTNAAKSDLQAAKDDLAKNDAGDADLKLAAVQESVALASSEENRPLVKARENLGLAESAVKNNNSAEAKATLTAAATALDSYAQNNSAKHSADAKNLSTEIKSAANDVSGNGESAANTKIENWWNKVADWTQATT